jgi:6-phosphogluconolactonase
MSPPESQVPENNPSPPPAAARTLAYGVSANGQIVRYSFQSVTGQLQEEKVFALNGKRPSFLAYARQRQVLYVANEAGGNGGVMAFAVQKENGDLTLLNEVPSNGDGPTHVAVDRSGQWLMSAHYNSGEVHIYPLLSDGRIGPQRTRLFAGNNAHQIISTPRGARVLVPCLGSQYVAQYNLNTDGGLTAVGTPLSLASGSGPRHLAFHPKGEWAYLVNELNSTVQALRLDPLTQEISLLGPSVSSLKNPVPNNSGAEVQVSPDGRFVYTSNRGDQSIAQFSIGTDGSLSLVNTYKTGGATPRHFSLDPSGRWILAANQESGTITVLGVQDTTGFVQAARQTVNLPAVQYVEVISL